MNTQVAKMNNPTSNPNPGHQPSSNPYEAPEAELQALEKMLATDNLIKRGFKVVITSAIAFGLVGALVGWLMGVLLPSYYRTVFNAGDRLDFIPWQVGLGLGFTQGLVLGTIVGCVVLLSAAWYKSRMRTMVEQKMATRD